ncbi:MAG: VWA domain-containing protein [Thermoanaerobaculia bacterium]|nr:VWA domain-containing protein [Thermoanaerobaculia bacterium]
MQSRSPFVCRLLVLALVFGLLIPSLVAADARDLVLVLDASGSMWGRMGGSEKIVIARQVLGDLIADLPDGDVALVAYGHRREGDCADIETLVPLSTLDRSGLKTVIDGIQPRGKTPLTASTQVAIDVVKERSSPATVILVSDGVETCGGDPCATVRAAREAGVDFVLHVVGFGIKEGDVAPLECAAQAGGGLYFPADDAGALADALQRAVEPPVMPDARLLVRAVGSDGLLDALVTVTRDGEDVATGRTYTSADTNPRVFGLAAGIYDVEVAAVGIPGASPVRFSGIELRAGDEVERLADFRSGEISVRVTRNGELSDATVRVRRTDSGDQVTASRTYRRPQSNPDILTVTPGIYDVEIGSVEIAGKPTRVWNSVQVDSGERTELSHEFSSGVLRLGATSGGELIDAVVRVLRAEGGQVAQGRTYTDPKSNPKTFVLTPGSYSVSVKPVGQTSLNPREFTVQVEVGATVEEIVTFDG